MSVTVQPVDSNEQLRKMPHHHEHPPPPGEQQQQHQQQQNQQQQQQWNQQQKQQQNQQQQQQCRYKEKYKQLRLLCRRFLYENAAIADEIARTNHMTAEAVAERRFLLKRVMVHEGIPEPAEPLPPSAIDALSAANSPDKGRSSPKRREMGTGLTSAAVGDTLSSNMLQASEMAAEAARTALQLQHSSRKSGTKKVAVRIPPIELDSVGRPLFPINLDAGLTIYSIGEITDKAGYHCPNAIYPVGYCCTRSYASLSDPLEACLYTCKVMESAIGPHFELSPENDPSQVFVASTPEECHKKLMKAVRNVVGCEIPVIDESDFFGLCHPIVRNLLQCCPGAKKCKGYQWIKFEVCRDAEMLTNVPSHLDPATCHEVLCSVLRKGKAW